MHPLFNYISLLITNPKPPPSPPPHSHIIIHLPAYFPFSESCILYLFTPPTNIYGHRLKKTRHPVRSANVKLQIDLLVVGWVTTSESRLLYILFDFFDENVGMWWGRCLWGDD